jgi:uncharacterized phage protein gp47/JayE
MITIPTIAQLKEDILADLEAQYGESIPVFGKIFLVAWASVRAAKLKLYYLGIGFLQKNIAPDTADQESAGGTLERFGRIKLGRNPFPATAGQYDVEVTGTVGATIDAGTTFKSNDDSLNPGKLFILDNAFTLATTPDTITLRALVAGLESQLSVGDELTATVPIANIDKTATVTAESVEPFAAEDIEVYRDKVVEGYQLEPQGGAAADYRLWAADAQGVKQTYAYATSGAANEVDVFVEATVADSTDGKGTPSAGLLSDVEDVIEFDPDTTKDLSERGRNPVNVFAVNVQAITPKDVDIKITTLVGSTAAIEALINEALAAMVNQIRPFVAGADILEDKNDILDTNRIIATILEVVPGAVFTSVELKVDSVIVTTYTFEGGLIPFPNDVTFV